MQDETQELPDSQPIPLPTLGGHGCWVLPPGDPGDGGSEHLSWDPWRIPSLPIGRFSKGAQHPFPPPLPPALLWDPCSRCTSSSMDVSLPLGMASFTLRQVNTRPMSRSVGLMSSWLMVVSLFPSLSSSWGGTSGSPDQAKSPPPPTPLRSGWPREGLALEGHIYLYQKCSLPTPRPKLSPRFALVWFSINRRSKFTEQLNRKHSESP